MAFNVVYTRDNQLMIKKTNQLDKPIPREQILEKLADDVDAFLRSGKRIKVIPGPPENPFATKNRRAPN